MRLWEGGRWPETAQAEVEVWRMAYAAALPLCLPNFGMSEPHETDQRAEYAARSADLAVLRFRERSTAS